MTFEQKLKSGQLGRIKDNKYLKFVQSLECSVCMSQNTTYHHLIGHSAYGGTSTKAPDYFTFPLCGYHHTGNQGIHRDVELWEEAYNDQWWHIIRTQREWIIKTHGIEAIQKVDQESLKERDREHIALTQMQWLMEHKK